MKLNCWEAKKCGREPGGSRAEQLGVCKSAIETRTDGFNDGDYGGRVCWAITGSMSRIKAEDTFEINTSNCLLCSFYKTVLLEEDIDLFPAKDVLKVLSSEQPAKKENKAG